MEHSSNEESDTENLETQHPTRAVEGTRYDFQIYRIYMSEFLRNPRRRDWYDDCHTRATHYPTTSLLNSCYKPNRHF